MLIRAIPRAGQIPMIGRQRLFFCTSSGKRNHPRIICTAASTKIRFGALRHHCRLAPPMTPCASPICAAPPRCAPRSSKSARIACSVFIIVAFTEMVIANFALGIDQIERRPIFIMKRIPNAIVIVLSDGIRDAELGNRLYDIAAFAFESKFRRVHA